MGLKNRDSAKTNYIKFKDGKFYLSTDKELTAPFEELSGVPTDFYLKDEEYNGISNRKMYIALEDKDGKYLVGFNIESSMTSTLLGFIMNVDLSKEISLHPRVENVIKNGKESVKRTILVSQAGKFMKSFFTKENPNGLPQMQKIERRGGKIEWVKDEILDFYEDLITNNLKVKANKNKGTIESVVTEDISTEKVTESRNKPLPWDDDTESIVSQDDDLPF